MPLKWLPRPHHLVPMWMPQGQLMVQPNRVYARHLYRYSCQLARIDKPALEYCYVYGQPEIGEKQPKISSLMLTDHKYCNVWVDYILLSFFRWLRLLTTYPIVGILLCNRTFPVILWLEFSAWAQVFRSLFRISKRTLTETEKLITFSKLVFLFVI